jgi:hypothetical protein
MRTSGVALFAVMIVSAQTSPTSGLARGILLERDAQTAAGEFGVRTAENLVLRYRFDRKTYVERDAQSIDVSRLVPGDRIEVLSDEGPANSLRYARTVHVLASPPPAPQLSAGRFRAYHSPGERSIPTGTLTFSGVVFRLSGSRVVLHTRGAGDQAILLRQDTRYLEDGEIVDAARLKPNTRVFVRAGRNLYNEVEAYQVIWGQILLP